MEVTFDFDQSRINCVKALVMNAPAETETHLTWPLKNVWLQVLVYHDLLGMMQHPHHAKVTPKFCKQYGNVGEVVQQALQQYRDDVTSGAFPSEQFSPYKLGSEQETASFAEQLDAAGFHNAANAVVDMSKS